MPHINGRLYTWKKLYRLQEQGIYYLELAEDAACKSMDPKRPYTHRQIHEQNIAIYSIVAARYPHWDRGAFRMRAPLVRAGKLWRRRLWLTLQRRRSRAARGSRRRQSLPRHRRTRNR